MDGVEFPKKLRDNACVALMRPPTIGHRSVVHETVPVKKPAALAG